MIDPQALVGMFDISAVRTNVTLAEVEDLARVGMAAKVASVVTMPWQTEFLAGKLDKQSGVLLGGVAGFPSGADTTAIKVATTKELLAAGCDEMDMVINIGALLGGQYDVVEEDVRAVVAVCEGRPVKTILEISFLTDDQIRKGAELAAKAGAAYIKMSTGWHGRKATPDVAKIIRGVVGGEVRIKASGGIRTWEDVVALYKAGCERFGIGLTSTMSILEEVQAQRSVRT